jgi:hypothetical protein
LFFDVWVPQGATMKTEGIGIFQRNAAFALPKPEAKIWRFMSLAELVSLLSKQALFFTRVDKPDDPFEGSLPKAVVAQLEKGFDTLTPRVLPTAYTANS